MDAIEAILTRRSVRTYKNKKISDEIINDLINVGFSAPSAGNQQPWHFIILDDSKIINKITDFHPYSKMLPGAQIAIIVCGDLEIETNKGFWVQDCSAATENILIAARAKGLGSCWLGLFPREDRVLGIRKLLKIPENVIPLSLISLGYPAVKQDKVNRYNSARIHKNKW
ncbi:MAG: NADH dehydrogenase [Thermoplasmatales archaeon SG8-52-3]|nr:MAG: NADH dehydrogenase [Thermoplasmatales archaeon SG8-52-3]